ncbi:hypothetical protein EI74_0245 [Mycoplasma testudineum]|uniref:Uncharacterized protein n=1 Tax=Mycoplasma testudineum TaxID=244584 RepID=A0A4R6IH73_9MOLU|nr:hypothetical protein [Mycoplasma testudineum]TDO21211.1 hypothetical protein EI74_0245 [Mycoplasma testudineum]
MEIFINIIKWTVIRFYNWIKEVYIETTKNTYAQKFENYIRSHNIGEKLVLNSRSKLAELYEWNGNPIEGKILDDYKLKLDVTLSYNETNMKNKSFESQLFEMIKEIKDEIVGIKADIVEMKTDIANIKVEIADIKVEIAEMKVEIADMKTDITVLKGFHNI